MSTTWEKLKARTTELDALGGAMGVLEWDQQTYLPPGGGGSRGEQLAVLGRIHHDRFVAPEVGEWLEELAKLPDLDDVQRASVFNHQRRWRRATCIPGDLVEAWSKARNDGYLAWMKAREADDFAPFEAPLQRLIDLTRAHVKLYGYQDHPYDALLEDYDPGSRVADLRPMFARLAAELGTFLDAVEGRPHPVGFADGLDIDGQRRLSERVLSDLGFDRRHGRLDLSEHPFSLGVSQDDVRITTHFREGNFLASLGGTIHEAGHGLYEQGLPAHLAGTALNRAAGMGLHESQSRFWENFVGRSEAFCRYLLPRMHGIWPSLEIDAAQLYGAMNRVERSLIRIFADEATYNLHIVARFELELAIVEGKLEARDLPDAWNDTYRRIVGVVAPSPHDGVLQDVHWSSGLFGYFPSYTVGNLYAASLGATIQEDVPDLWAQVERGRFDAVLGWLRAKVHVHGHTKDAPEIFRAAVGDRDPVKDLVDHLWNRHGTLYGVSR